MSEKHTKWDEKKFEIQCLNAFIGPPMFISCIIIIFSLNAALFGWVRSLYHSCPFIRSILFSHLYLIGWCSLFNAVCVVMCIKCVVIFLSSIYICTLYIGAVAAAAAAAAVAHGTTKCEMSVLDDCSNPAQKKIQQQNHMFCACLILCVDFMFFFSLLFFCFHLTFVCLISVRSSHICSAMNGHKKIHLKLNKYRCVGAAAAAAAAAAERKKGRPTI